MLRSETLPRSLTRLLQGSRPGFSRRAFDTFTVLVMGLIVAPGRRTVCGMLTASGMISFWHHSRAHRFFAAACRDRLVHVVADRAYICKTLRRLPANVTLTGPLPQHAALWEVHPDLDDPPCMRG
jgi:hypothetical protein